MLFRYLSSLWLFSWAFFIRVAITADVPVGVPGGPQYYPVTGSNSGVTSQSGSRPFRRNILDLQKDVPAWSLYVQALASMQKANESSQLSYFQVAGIHGRPYITWNNVNEVPGSSWRGYCTHSSVLFLNWHRPYLALFEQILGGYAQDIAKQYPASVSSVYQDAADNLRMPYWDWASTPEMPDIINHATIQIDTPTGTQSVSNPLLQYTFQKFPFDPSYFPSNTVFANDRYTKRSPDTATSESNPATANYWLANNKIMERTWSALVKSKDFNSFSTTAVSGPSLEAIHNDIHGDVGGSYGHMMALEYSAFDPIFWLHHTNVDRLFAMWQAINPNSSMTPLSEPGTYAILRNSIDTVDTPLPPFTYNTQGNTYTSASSSNTRTFGYTYPEVEDWSQSPEQLKANVSAQINRMYDPNGMFHKKSRSITPRPSLQDRSALIPGSTIREWSIAIEVSKFALDGDNFAVRFFLGDVPSDPKDWPRSPSCAGSVLIMPPPHIGDQPMREVILHDEISLEKAVAKSSHDSNSVGDVVPYLKGILNWRVQKLDGTVVSNDQIPSLKVTVFDEMVTLPKDITELPQYGSKTVHEEITNSKAGGYGRTTAN
ncbi:uncharacterized protein BP5553_02039 [Venustampulla echinocandica]|uniref:Tyrosinase copper-binding domain-containing protein n=1 Tax=Venustampulla echinocandica TaxID=2656787 RepID=A0A370U2Q0_9HELO|nr:uncharacterized protein BP5553_02039 [Venustampulla echinocandica]RDL42060.1 hypothetical protein BP5553_02039 [Venustampulla echinocandica]